MVMLLHLYSALTYLLYITQVVFGFSFLLPDY